MKQSNICTSPLIKKAAYFAAERHDGAYRKGTDVPFFVHPTLVALGVSRYTDDEQTISAAFLHDVMEDCGVTKQQMEELFGKHIAGIVEEVRSPLPTKEYSWKEKKEVYLAHITAASTDALIIVAVDKMNNMGAYFGYLAEKGEENINTLFNASRDEYVWYYNEVGTVLKTKLAEHIVVEDYFRVLRTCTQLDRNN